MSASTSSKLLGVVLLAALGGCSLVAQGTSQDLVFTSDPEGATFTVAGQTATTPATLPVPKDDYTITFQREGYKEAEFELRRKINPWFYGSIAMGVVASTIDIATGAWKEFDTTEVHVVLEPLPGRVLELPVSITSEPPGADIVIGVRSYGVTPKELRLSWPPGEHEKEVSLRLAGHAPKTVALPRTEKKLHADLEALPVPVTLKFSSKPAGAELRIDGRPQGKTPVPVEFVWKKGDKPRVAEWALEGYRTEKRELTRESADQAVELQELVEEIVLPLKIQPAGAKVLVDGVALPDGAKQVVLKWSVSTTKHSIVLSQPGYTTRTVEVLRAAAAGPLEVRLAAALPGNP